MVPLRLNAVAVMDVFALACGRHTRCLVSLSQKLYMPAATAATGSNGTTYGRQRRGGVLAGTKGVRRPRNAPSLPAVVKMPVGCIEMRFTANTLSLSRSDAFSRWHRNEKFRLSDVSVA